jgi:GNAT superfamily N-acetyltransferase
MLRPVEIRARAAHDLPAVVAMVERSLERGEYPPYRPDDIGAFLDPPDLLGAWVAVVDGVVVAHVANHATSSPEVMAAASEATGRPASGLAVLARLLVEPEHRGTGLAEALVRRAEQEAHSLGRRPVLDVALHFTRAARTYERLGWTRAATVTVVPRSGEPFREHVYVGPAPPDVEPAQPASG